MNELEGWEELEREWREQPKPWLSNIVRDNEGNPYIGSGRGSSGLCVSMIRLPVPWMVRFVMENKIRPMIEKSPKRTFAWPRTVEGAKQRADFCAEQARLIREGTAGG